MFLNNLLEVFFEAWKTAEVFQRLVAEASYVPMNLNRDKNLGEIKIEGMKLEGKAPEFLWLSKTKPSDVICYMPADPSKKTLCYDGEIHFQGKIKLLITTSYKLNIIVSGFYNIPIKLEICISRINGKIRLQYSTDPAQGSYFQFLGRPAVKVDVEPVVGQSSSVNLNSLPKVTSIINQKVNQEIENLCFPSRLEMNVPCTTETPLLDKDGKIIPKKPIIDGLDPLLISKLVEALQEKHQVPVVEANLSGQKKPEVKETTIRSNEVRGMNGFSAQKSRTRPQSPMLK